MDVGVPLRSKPCSLFIYLSCCLVKMLLRVVPSTTLVVSRKQILLKLADKRIALALAAKDRLLSLGL